MFSNQLQLTVKQDAHYNVLQYLVNFYFLRNLRI